MKSTTRVFATAMLSALTVSCPSWALELPSIFGSGMVLQRGKPVTIWGWAETSTVVSINNRVLGSGLEF